MLSHLRRGHHHEFDGTGALSARTMNGHAEHWKSTDRANASLLSDPYQQRSNSTNPNPDLSRAFRVDAHLLAIVRTDDKRNAFYSAEVVSKLRQKQHTQSFINKPCSLFVTDRHLVIFDRGTQVIAETILLENVDPTCVHADTPDTLNDIFMYRLLDRQLQSTTSQASSTTSNDSAPVVVFKCSNNEAKLLVDSIRTASGKALKHPKSARSEVRAATLERRVTESYYGGGTTALPPPPPGMMLYDQQSTHIQNPTYVVGPQHALSTTQHSTLAATDYYKRLTEELNKCFDDIELFVRYLEALLEYTKELERDHRRKEKKSAAGLKQMIEKLPDDRYFIDILQKFKHSINLLGELKQIIHNPNAPELIHYLLSPLQFILYTLRTKHVNQLQLAQDIWSPPLNREARDLLLNCLTSKEHEILRNLGPAWIRTAEDTSQKLNDYRPIFFEGRALWVQDTVGDHHQPPPPIVLQSARSTERMTVPHPFNQFDERQQQQQQTAWNSARHSNQNNNNNAVVVPSSQVQTGHLTVNHNTTYVRQPSPLGRFDTSTVDRSAARNGTQTNGMLENYNIHMQNEHAWAIDRKRAGAKICAVKIDRKGQNNKELTVRRGELIEIEDSTKKWWRARNFNGDVGHVPNNIVEEIEIEHRPIKVSPSNPSAFLPRSASVPNHGSHNIHHRQKFHATEHYHHHHHDENYSQYLHRSPSYGNNFIMQSSSSTTTNPKIFRDQTAFPLPVSSPPPPPPPSFPPPPPPPPLPAHLLTISSATWQTLQAPDSSRKGRGRPRANTTLSDIRSDQLQQELTQRITDRVGLLSQQSSSDEVRRWLQSKHVSTDLAHNLYGLNGDELFQISKREFDRFTSEAESTRVYNLILQQKQLSGFQNGVASQQHNPSLLNTSALSSVKSNTINDADDEFSLPPDDTLSRTLKIKLKQRRDKIEQAELTDRTVL